MPNPSALNLLVQRILPEASLRITALPLCPALRLYLLDPHNMQRRYSREETERILADTPFWAFCWASGQALAHDLLSHPEKVHGKRVLDFGAGSGVAGIAAALAGAREVWACDLDEKALQATRANAALNDCVIKTCKALEEAQGPFDLLLASDVLYDRENLPWLDRFLNFAPQVLVAESRLKNIAVVPYRQTGEIRADTWPNLDDFDKGQTVRFYEARR